MRYTSMTTFNKEPIARPTTFAESFNMKYLTLSLIAIILVTSLKHQPIHNESQSNTDNKIAIIAPLEAPVYAEAQEVQPVAVEPTSPPAPTPQPVTVSGNWVGQCNAWAAQAGITLDDSAIKLLERESHCNPLARNPSSSAGGIPQALPYTKMGCQLSIEDAPCQLKWFYNYTINRYGSFANALAHSYSVGWY